MKSFMLLNLGNEKVNRVLRTPSEQFGTWKIGSRLLLFQTGTTKIQNVIKEDAEVPQNPPQLQTV